MTTPQREWWGFWAAAFVPLVALIVCLPAPNQEQQDTSQEIAPVVSRSWRGRIYLPPSHTPDWYEQH